MSGVERIGLGLAALARPAYTISGRATEALPVPAPSTSPSTHRAGGGPSPRSSPPHLLEPSVGPAPAAAAAAGALVVVEEALANGPLAPGCDDASPGLQTITADAARLGLPIDQLAIAAALAQPCAWRVLSGCVTVEQVRSNTAATAEALPADAVHELVANAENGP